MQNVFIPVLRKDFTCDEYMIYQAKVMGASAVLLICSVLEDGRLKAYHQLADESGISTPEQAAKMCQSADGAIVGSAIVKLCEKYGKDCVPYVAEYVKSMVEACK